MSQHKNNVKGMAPEELAGLFSNTTYGFQKEFFTYMASFYYHESFHDSDRGYKELSTLLLEISDKTEGVKDVMGKIWNICKNKTEVIE